MQFIKRWIYWHNFELWFIVNIDLWIVFCDKFWSADLMAHTPTHEWQVSLQSTYTWILYTLWTLLSYVKINIEYPVNPSCFQVLPPSLYAKLSTSSRRTLVVTTVRIRPHFCVIHINIISLHKLTHCVRDSTLKFELLHKDFQPFRHGRHKYTKLTFIRHVFPDIHLTTFFDENLGDYVYFV